MPAHKGHFVNLEAGLEHARDPFMPQVVQHRTLSSILGSPIGNSNEPCSSGKCWWLPVHLVAQPFGNTQSLNGTCDCDTFGRKCSVNSMRDVNQTLVEFEQFVGLEPVRACRLLGIAYVTYAHYRNNSRELPPYHQRHIRNLGHMTPRQLEAIINEVCSGQDSK